MDAYKNLKRSTALLTFLIAAVVYYFSVERSGSLWDCGEFISGAYKLQVVHPPGAPLFLLIGRIFTLLPEWLSDDPSHIAFAVNMLSGLSTAGAAACVTLITIITGKLALVGRRGALDQSMLIVLGLGGLAAGLATAFATSIWFSAVEGEVYAMSTFLMTLSLYITYHWYEIPKSDPHGDRWFVLAIFVASLSVGVHLLSLLIYPALSILYYFKKYKEHNFVGFVLAALAGLGILFFVQKVVIVGIPTIWSMFDYLFVNSFGLPPNSGIVPTVILLLALVYFAFTAAQKRNNALAQNLVVAAFLCMVSYSTFGVVIIRSAANTPINMNKPSDPFRLLPYINREQYGERPLLNGPHFEARPVSREVEDRYGLVEEKQPDGSVEKKYTIVDQKVTPVYASKDKIFFPRMGDGSQGRDRIYKANWLGLDPNKPLPPGRPNFADNISYFVRYQIGWMYWRYFMWNFSGKQNGKQGYTPNNVKEGNWISGIPFIDEARLYNTDEMTERMKNDPSRNTYFMIPFILGVIGLIFHLKKKPKDFLTLLIVFLITGLGLIVYSNQPPREPRERDYVLVGSFFTFTIWIGLAAVAIYNMLKERMNLNGNVAALIGGLLVLTAPIIMGFQNYDDHSRKELSGARDYAYNFLQSCEENAIIFTYGDNDTYPLWYAQEVEGIRTDVRVVNLSLIQVDWYIYQLQRKINDSPPIKLSIAKDKIRGGKRNQIPINTQESRVMSVHDVLKHIEDDHPTQSFESFVPTTKFFIPVDHQKAIENGALSPSDTNFVNNIPMSLEGKNYILKGDLAVLDIIANNINDRPIYFAVTCIPSALMGLDDYTRLEGLGLRIVPKKTFDQNAQGYGLAGKGAIDVDKCYELFTDVFKWGNLDTKQQFVDESFAPSIQYLRILALRTADNLLRAKENDKAIAIVKKYFEAFPRFNFEPSLAELNFLNILLRSGEKEILREQITLWADEVEQNLTFYFSLDNDVIESSFKQDLQLQAHTAQRLTQLSQALEDEAFTKDLNDRFAPFEVNGVPN